MFSCSLAGSSVENVCLHITFNHLMQRVCVCACALKSDLMVAFSDGQSSDAGPLLGRGTGTLVRGPSSHMYMDSDSYFAKY